MFTSSEDTGEREVYLKNQKKKKKFYKKTFLQTFRTNRLAKTLFLQTFRTNQLSSSVVFNLFFKNCHGNMSKKI